MVQVEIKRGMADGVGPVSTVWTETFGASQQSNKVKATMFDSEDEEVISGSALIR